VTAAEDVEAAPLSEWAFPRPHLAERSPAGVSKGWRWAGEMEEIAQTMAASGLPDGFRQPR
jgi:hypothetical protein